MMRTLFLQAPSFDGFDGGAGSRYQAKREIRSFWYPTWLAQPAALVPNSKLIDGPPHDTRLADVVSQARDFDMVVLHTSTPSFSSDVKTIEKLKEANPSLKAGLIGAKVAVDPTGSLQASSAIDFVARNEFDFTIKEVADDRPWSSITGLSYRTADGAMHHNPERAILENMDSLPFVTPVYQRDLDDREILHRLSEAPLHLHLHRPRLQIALHLLPLAADRGRPSLPHPQRRPCDRGDRLGAEGLPAGEGVLLRRRHLHRRSAAGRGHRHASWASSASPGPATPRPMCRARR